jgi:NADH-quinone oxidoreductase subunit C
MTDNLLNNMMGLSDYIPSKLKNIEVAHNLGTLTLTVPVNQIAKAAKFLRDDKHTACQQLMDITVVDYPDDMATIGRFEVVYQFLSVTHNHRICLKARVDEDTAVPSVAEIYPTANWFEREIWDMFGVMFANHPDLRRLLTDYGFSGHPLRKDFPLTGFVELRYDAAQQRCVYEPVKLPQDYRVFDFESPWEGITQQVLAGDEKANNFMPKFMPQIESK